MKKIFLILATCAAAVTLRAQSFEDLAADQPFAAEDAFAGVSACDVLNIKNIHPFSLDEAAALIKPCIAAAASKYAVSAVAEVGFVIMENGKPSKAGLLIKTNLLLGSKGHRDWVLALARREGRLLGHMAKLLTKNDVAPAAVSTLQKGLESCMIMTVVRDIRNGNDFVKIYGSCLTGNPGLKIKEVRAAEGMAVTVKTEADPAQIETYNGFITVNSGKGPVTVMIAAYGSQIFLP